MVKRLIFAALLSLLAANQARAADVACGRDTDAGASVDQVCPTPDADADGFPDSVATTSPFTAIAAATALDCDSTNPQLFPGVITGSGCAASEARRCQDDGTYTSCFDFATMNLSTQADDLCGTGYTNIEFFDPTKSADTGTGAFASQRNLLSLSDSSMATYDDPTAGDCLIVLGSGDFTQTYVDGATTRMLYFNAKDGTSSNKIQLVMLSGAALIGQGSSPTAVPIIQGVDSDYWVINGGEIDGTGGYSTAGIDCNNCDNIEILNLTVHDIDGEQDNNLAGIKLDGADSVFVHNNIVYGNYERANPTGDNNAEIYVTHADAFRVWSNLVYTTRVGGEGTGIKNKHAYSGTNSGSSIRGNIILDTYKYGIKLHDQAITVTRNFLYNNAINGTSSIGWIQDGTAVTFKNTLVYNNTIINGPGLETNSRESTTIGSPALGFYDNVVQDDKATTYGGDADFGLMRIDHYSDATVYANLVTSGALTIHDNCYWNTTGLTLLFSIFGGGAHGAKYSGLAAFVSGTTFDDLSYNENPAFDVYDRATSTNCADKGWLLLTDDDGDPEPTPTPAPATTATGGGKSHRSNIRGRR